MRYVSILVLGLSVIRCGGAPSDGPSTVETAPAALLDNSAWREVDAAEDPFDDRPASVLCGAGGFGAEADTFEVETERCHYLTAVQPTLAAVEVGDVVSIPVWHLDLWAEAPAEGHVALMIGDDVVVDLAVPIPAEAAAYTIEHTVTKAAPAGTPVYFHVHNHGYNSWRLGPVDHW